MKFDTPATDNPIDRLKLIGHATDRIDGSHKVTGTATYAYEWHEAARNPAYGFVVGAAIARGRIASMDLAAATASPGVLAIVTADSAGPLAKGDFNTVKLLGGPRIDHYHQAVALVVANTFEQARDAAQKIRIGYVADDGSYDLAAAKDAAGMAGTGYWGEPATRTGDFDGAFAARLINTCQVQNHKASGFVERPRGRNDE